MKKIIGIIFTIGISAYIIGVGSCVVKWAMGKAAYNSATDIFIPQKAFGEAIDFQFTWIAWVILLSIIVIYVLYIKIQALMNKDDNEKGYNISEKGTYGTANVCDKEELKKIPNVNIVTNVGEKGDKGIILGITEPIDLRNKKDRKKVPEFVTWDVVSGENRNIGVFGSAGKQKTRAFVMNFIFQAVLRGESIIVTDPSCEIERKTRAYLEKRNYMVRSLNFVDTSKSDHWDIMGEMGTDFELAQIMADTIIANTTSENGSDPYYDNGELNLLKALMLYVSESANEKENTFAKAYDMMVTNTSEELEALFEAKKDSPCYKPFCIYNKNPKVSTNFLQGLSSRLQVFQVPAMQDITSKGARNIRIEDAGERPCCFFIHSSDQVSTYDFLVTLFTSVAFSKLVNLAISRGNEYEDGKLKVPVNFLLDEVANVGAIPNLQKKISTVRKYDIRLELIFQNFPQFQNRYPNGKWEEILSNCACQIFLGCQDRTTSEYISDQTGEATIEVSSTSGVESALAPTGERVTSSVGRRNVYTANEIKKLAINRELIWLPGTDTIELYKCDYSLHPEAQILEKENEEKQNGETSDNSRYAEAEYSNEEEKKEKVSRPEIEEKPQERSRGPEVDEEHTHSNTNNAKPKQQEKKSSDTKSKGKVDPKNIQQIGRNNRAKNQQGRANRSK